MTAVTTTQESKTTPPWHSDFLAMLPVIHKQARFAFRSLPPETREEMVAAVVAACLAAFVRLVERGKQDVAYPGVLANYGILQVRSGRRLGGRPRVRDVMSDYAQFRKNFRLERLDQFDEQAGEWKEILVEDVRSGPAETAASRIDFATWLKKLPALRRKLAELLARGESTVAAARRFSISAGRISQIRRELHNSWLAFHGEPVTAGAAAA